MRNKSKLESSASHHYPDSGSSNEGWLSIDEELAVLRALCLGSGGKFTGFEGKKVLEWAKESRLRTHMLELAFRGMLQIRVRKDGELTFRAHVEDSVFPNVPQDAASQDKQPFSEDC